MKFGHFNDQALPESGVGYRCPSWDPMPDGKKNVVVLGCSHTYGEGHDNDTHWVHFVSQHNTGRLRYWNLGQPGASADKIVRILYGCEKVINPRLVIVCWPAWSRRERLGLIADSISGSHPILKHEDEDTDRHNFLKNVFFVEKYAEKNDCKVFHCFAEESYAQHLRSPNVLHDYTIRNCWPYWDKFTQRKVETEPSLAKDGKHYGVEHHKRFAEIFLGQFKSKLR